MAARKIPTMSFDDDFWDVYDLKRNRMAAERAWNRLSAKDRYAACMGISAYREECLRSGIAMMYPQGYLNDRRWEDEPSTTPPSPVPVKTKEEPVKEPELW